MYIDGVIVFSLFILALVIAMMVYIGQYAKRHIDHDIQQAQREEEQKKIANVLLGD